VSAVADLDEDQVIVATKTDHQWGECLQVADVVAWSMYQKYEKGDMIFFNLFKDKLEAEINLDINGEGIICLIDSMNNDG